MSVELPCVSVLEFEHPCSAKGLTGCQLFEKSSSQLDGEFIFDNVQFFSISQTIYFLIYL